MFTSPPPDAPEASIAAPDPTLTLPPFAVALTWPPRWPVSLPDTSSLPVTSSVPPSPPSRISTPPSWLTAWARIAPPTLTTLSTTPPAARAVIVTTPPSALMVPVFDASGIFLPCWSTGWRDTGWPIWKLISPSPARSTVNVSAPPMVTRPRRALMTPWLAAMLPTSPTRPPSRTVIVPAFTTPALAFGDGTSKVILPSAMNACGLLVFAVDATSAPTFTCAPLANSTPAPFTSTICPLAVSWPAITDGSGPITRFSVTALAPGCRKSTRAPGPIEKLRQSITPRCVAWLTVTWLAPVVIVALPPTTVPPAGNCAFAGAVNASTPQPISAANAVAASSWRRGGWGYRVIPLAARRSYQA